MTPRDIEWLAGLLEGEGCFGFYYLKRNQNGTGYYCPQIRLSMTDRDVVGRAAKLMGTRVYLREGTPKGNKPVWTTRAAGAKAAGWMMTLYMLLGERRRTKIQEVLWVWRQTSTNPGAIAATWKLHR